MHISPSKTDALNIDSISHPQPPMAHAMQTLSQQQQQQPNFNFRAPQNIQLLPSHTNASNLLQGSPQLMQYQQQQLQTQQMQMQSQAPQTYMNIGPGVAIPIMIQPPPMHLVHTSSQQNSMQILQQQQQSQVQFQPQMDQSQTTGNTIGSTEKEEISEVEETIEELLEKAAAQAKIPLTNALAVISKLKDEGVYTSEILISLDAEDGKRLLGLGLWKSLEMVSKSLKAKRKSKGEERRKATSADLQQHLNNYAVSRGHALFTLVARSTKEVFCNTCRKSIQLNKEGSISNVKRHVEGREDDVYTRHQRNFDAQNHITPVNNGKKVTPKKRKNQSSDDPNKRTRPNDDEDKKDEIESPIVPGNTTSISDMMTSNAPNLTSTSK